MDEVLLIAKKTVDKLVHWKMAFEIQVQTLVYFFGKRWVLQLN